MTFSIVARCPQTSDLGVAVSTAIPAVGAINPFARARVGAMATQGWSNPYLGIDGRSLLTQGLMSAEVLRQYTGLPSPFFGSMKGEYTVVVNCANYTLQEVILGQLLGHASNSRDSPQVHRLCNPFSIAGQHCFSCEFGHSGRIFCVSYSSTHKEGYVFAHGCMLPAKHHARCS
jgi:hypothetical protein